MTKELSNVGSEISHDLGAKMVKDFQDLHPDAPVGFYIGREIILDILNQHDCQGIDFYNAINEAGEQTAVYCGVDSNNEKMIGQYVDDKGSFKVGIVADRSTAPGAVPWDWW